MKQFIIISILVLAFIVDSNAQTVQNVNALNFKELIAKGDYILVDVRTPDEFSRGHIQGSTAINVADPGFPSKVNLLQKDKTILIYCLTGSRSSYAANYLIQNGFKKVYNLQNGLMDWSQQGFALEQSSKTFASASTTYTEQSFNQLLKDNKLVLVDFHAVWCAPCKAMNPVIDKVSTNFKGKAQVVKIDVEANKTITTAWQVQSVPGFVIFKEGKKVWSHNGTISYDDLVLAITKFI